MKTLITFCTVLLCLQLHAQNKIFTGYYVTDNGDSVTGTFPKYSEWNKNPSVVDFIPANTATSVQLTPLNCQKFKIENQDEFLSYLGKRLINPIEDNEAINNRGYADFTDQISDVTVFLRLVARAPACEIYILNDNARTNFFYKLPGEPIEELKFKKYFDQNNLHEMAEYRQQLNNLFGHEIAQRNLSKSLEELPYTEQGIAKFIERLFQIKKTAESRPNPTAGWIVTAGVSLNFLSVTGEPSIDEVRNSYSNSYAPLLSVGYIFPTGRNFNRYFFYPQVRIYNNKNSTQYSYSVFIKELTFQSRLTIQPTLNGGVNIVNKEDCRLFLYGGVGMLLLVKNAEKDKKIVASDGRIYLSYETPTAKMTYSSNVSAGVLLKNRFTIQASYNFPTPIADFQNYSAMHSCLQIGVGYKFIRRS
jgi:hypothetical protein